MALTREDVRKAMRIWQLCEQALSDSSTTAEARAYADKARMLAARYRYGDQIIRHYEGTVHVPVQGCHPQG